MSLVADLLWLDANQQALLQQLERIRALLGAQLREPPDAAADVVAAPAEPPEPLTALCAAFDLSPFERDILLLCAGVELQAEIADLCAAVQGDAARTYPTFGLALAALPEPHWSALLPTRPLRRWRLIDMGPGAPLTRASLRIDERVLHHLTGLPYLDERLAGLVHAVDGVDDLLPSQHAATIKAARVWQSAPSHQRLPLLHLCGRDPATLRAAAGEICAAVGLELHVMAGAAVPHEPREQDALARLWEREAVLSGSALLVEIDDSDNDERQRLPAIVRLLDTIFAPLLVSSSSHWREKRRTLLSFDVPNPTRAEQRALWDAGLGIEVGSPNGDPRRLASQFDLTPARIRAACAEALSLASSPEDARERLWDSGRRQARSRVSELAQHVDTSAAWDDLVLPAAQQDTLREIALHLEQRTRVYEDWGFAARTGRGLGISALFVGPSGTGKTLAAEVLAHTLRLDLFRVDLSQVVSKYIGETEKNLRRVFDAADEGGAVLFFDEADALFGRRSEVKDSHDRYANIEVSYLLQRMEAYRGLAILATNMKDALDPAFLRRIRFVVHFPFPDAALRAEIWRRVFPRETPAEGLEIETLARLNVAGGNIRNIAVNAAFLAAGEESPVRMSHIVRAVRGEYAKLEKPLTEFELVGRMGGSR
jgi:hypothetical protein